VHRDVKPANLIVDREGTVKVLDLGLARFFHDKSDALTKKYEVGSVLGTADYLAPEQAVDSHNADARADVYSLGMTFYFLLAGHNPYGEGTVYQKLLWAQMREPKPIREERPEVPEGLAAVLAKMTAKEPSRRYQTMAELAEALAPWTQTPISPPSEAELPRYGAALRNAGLSGTGLSGPRAPGSSARLPAPAKSPSSRRLGVHPATAGATTLAAEDEDPPTVVSVREDVADTTPSLHPAAARKALPEVTRAGVPGWVWWAVGGGTAAFVVLLGIAVALWWPSATAQPTPKAPVDNRPPVQPDLTEHDRAILLNPRSERAWLARGRMHAAAGRHDQAAADFAQALTLVEDAPSPWWADRGGIDDELVQMKEVFDRVVKIRPRDAQLWVARARFHARRAQWREAAAATARVIQLDPSDHMTWYSEGVLRLQLGDREGYRRACREMLARFGQTNDPYIADRTAKTCLLVSDAVEDMNAVAQLAERSITGTERSPEYPWFLLARGMADYRTGEFATAVERLRGALDPRAEESYRDSSVYLFLAMAHHRLKQPNEARTALDRGRTLIEQKLPKPGRELLGTNWGDWLRCQLFLREAEAVLQGK
jgi:tetratricopeptide (TPR) repeat protein